jgi:3-dehydroquinate dehydratase I
LKAATQKLLESAPLVVGTVHSAGSIQAAAKLKPGDVDVLEFRIDALADRLDAAERAMQNARFPALLTVRHPEEGGINNLDAKKRKELYRRFLPHAALIDVELRSLPGFSDIVAEARAAGCAIVVSNHDFKKTPLLKALIEREKRACAEGADVFKVACVASSAHELAKLLEFTARPAKWPRSVMGMGRFGRASRLALAEAGSVLNYGYLHEANAPGQWEARELRKLIPRLLP